jgi:hypothetical protein
LRLAPFASSRARSCRRRRDSDLSPLTAFVAAQSCKRADPGQSRLPTPRPSPRPAAPAAPHKPTKGRPQHSAIRTAWLNPLLPISLIKPSHSRWIRPNAPFGAKSSPPFGYRNCTNVATRRGRHRLVSPKREAAFRHRALTFRAIPKILAWHHPVEGPGRPIAKCGADRCFEKPSW